MNPFDALPLDALQAIAVYSWVAMIACLVLGFFEIEKARRAKTPPVAPAPPSATFAWRHCPSGHGKMLSAVEPSCPLCGARMVVEVVA